MCNLSPKTILSYDYRSYKGFFAENFVAQAFLCAQKQDLFSWQERTAEIAFLREIDGEVIPVEVKAGINTKAKSLSVFSQTYSPPYCVIFSGKNLHLTQKTHYLPLYLANQFPL